MGSTSHPSQVTSTCSTRQPRIEDEDVAPDDVVLVGVSLTGDVLERRARRSHSSSTADTTSRTRIDDSVGGGRGGRGAGLRSDLVVAAAKVRRRVPLHRPARRADESAPPQQGGGGDTQGEVAPESRYLL